MEDYIKRYHELYDEMAQAKDPKKMIVFGDAERWVFAMVAAQRPELAERCQVFYRNLFEIDIWNKS